MSEHDMPPVSLDTVRKERAAALEPIRADLVTARQTILRAVAGHDDADLPAALRLIANTLEAGLPRAHWLDTDDVGLYFLRLANACHDLRPTERPPDLPAAAAGLDRALRMLCPHAREHWYTAPDTAGRILTTCHQCGVSWYTT